MADKLVNSKERMPLHLGETRVLMDGSFSASNNTYSIYLKADACLLGIYARSVTGVVNISLKSCVDGDRDEYVEILTDNISVAQPELRLLKTGNCSGYLRLDVDVEDSADLAISVKGVMDGKESDDLAKELHHSMEVKLTKQYEMLSNINENLQIIVNHLRQITNIESDKGDLY